MLGIRGIFFREDFLGSCLVGKAVRGGFLRKDYSLRIFQFTFELSGVFVVVFFNKIYKLNYVELIFLIFKNLLIKVRLLFENFFFKGRVCLKVFYKLFKRKFEFFQFLEFYKDSRVRMILYCVYVCVFMDVFFLVLVQLVNI